MTPIAVICDIACVSLCQRLLEDDMCIKAANVPPTTSAIKSANAPPMVSAKNVGYYHDLKEVIHEITLEQLNI